MPSGPATPRAIVFGTSGWRGVLGEEFTFERARAVAGAVAEWIAAEVPRGRVVVAHDTRFLADRVADDLARVLAGLELRPLLAAGAVATPVATRAVRTRRAAAGLIVTASHNPPEYLGIKVVAPWGGVAPPSLTRRLERRALACLGRAPSLGREPRRRVDLVAPYAEALLGVLDRGALRRARLHVHYDALHGTGAGVLDAVLRRAGVCVRVERGEPDPRFGGGPPDPTAERLRGLSRSVRAARGLRLGLATDGDADRYAALDADGRVLSESETLALLIDHLARSGRCRRGVVLSVATGSLPARVAASHGLRVERRGIGFKHLTAALLEGVADVAGEESGGFAWAPFARDKDGLLAGCLLAELVAQTRAPLGARLRELVRAHGASASGRIALPLDRRARAGLAALRRAAPSRVGGAHATALDARDGLRVELTDGFVMWRVSGTEPLLRIYAEAPSRERLRARLRAARHLLAQAARP